jgi:hypothetical protein
VEKAGKINAAKPQGCRHQSVGCSWKAKSRRLETSLQSAEKFRVKKPKQGLVVKYDARPFRKVPIAILVFPGRNHPLGGQAGVFLICHLPHVLFGDFLP